MALRPFDHHPIRLPKTLMEENPKEPPMNPYVGVALAAGGASVLIAFIGFCMVMHLSLLTDGTMWAIAAMVGAPSVMGMGIAFVMSQKPEKE
jgi:hypothetical protein